MPSTILAKEDMFTFVQPPTTFQTRVAFAYLQKIQSLYRPGAHTGLDQVLQRESVKLQFNNLL